MPRRFVPFGSHWAMGIDVPYSLGVIDGGQFWSCGQCPLNLRAEVLAPGDLPAQLRIVADLIRKQFAPHGIATSSIAKLVAYVAGDPDELADSKRFLMDALSPVPLVVAIGVPPFYYPGMRVEIDVYGATGGPVRLADGVVRSGDLVHVTGSADAVGATATEAGLSMDQLICARVYGHADNHLPTKLFDGGSAVRSDVPAGCPAIADLVFATDAGHGIVYVRDEICLTRRSAGDYLGLLGRSTNAEQTLAEAARSIMETFKAELAGGGLSFADVVKQQTHYVGGANAEDLYANMTIRNSYYASPGPASTGLAIAGFADSRSKISIEVIARRR